MSRVGNFPGMLPVECSRHFCQVQCLVGVEVAASGQCTHRCIHHMPGPRWHYPTYLWVIFDKDEREYTYTRSPGRATMVYISPPIFSHSNAHDSGISKSPRIKSLLRLSSSSLVLASENPLGRTNPHILQPVFMVMKVQ